MSNSLKIVEAHELILHFPKGGKPSLANNEWLIWSGSQDEGVLPNLEHGKKNILMPFTWWVQHHHEVNVQAKAKASHIGVWFAADEDILKHADLIEQGKLVWPLVAAHFPIFRDGRSFSTAALLRDRFEWQGEVRAIGDVLIDQLLQAARVGFDAFELRTDQNLDIGLKQFYFFSVTTQNSWRDTRSTQGTI